MQNPIKPPQCTYSHEKKKKIGWLCNIEFKRLYVIILSSDIDKVRNDTTNSRIKLSGIHTSSKIMNYSVISSYFNLSKVCMCANFTSLILYCLTYVSTGKMIREQMNE